MFRHLCHIFVLAITLTAVPPAVAQANPMLANCEEIRDEATSTQAEICASHLGCRLVLKMHDACFKAKRFLDRLRDLTSSTVTTGNGVEPDAIFEAATPPDLPLFQRNRRAKEAAQSVRAKPVGLAVLTGKKNGEDFVYYGGVEAGRKHGVGINISDSEISKGTYKNGLLDGPAEYIRPSIASRTIMTMEAGMAKGPVFHEGGDRTYFIGSNDDAITRSGVGRMYSGGREGVFVKGTLVPDSGGTASDYYEMATQADFDVKAYMRQYTKAPAEQQVSAQQAVTDTSKRGSLGSLETVSQQGDLVEISLARRDLPGKFVTFKVSKAQYLATKQGLLARLQQCYDDNKGYPGMPIGQYQTAVVECQLKAYKYDLANVLNPPYGDRQDCTLTPNSSFSNYYPDVVDPKLKCRWVLQMAVHDAMEWEVERPVRDRHNQDRINRMIQKK